MEAKPELVLNVDGILSRMFGDRNLLREMVLIYLDNSAQLLDTMRHALGRGDAVAVQHAAHTLKGASNYFQAPETVDAALTVETLAREERLDEAEGAWTHLVAETGRLQRALLLTLSTLAPMPPAEGVVANRK